MTIHPITPKICNTTENVQSDECPSYRMLVEHGDDLISKLMDIQHKYMHYLTCYEGFGYLTPLSSRESFLSIIDSLFENIKRDCKYFSYPDLSHSPSIKNLKKDELQDLLEFQKNVKKLHPSITYTQICSYALRSYKRLEGKVQAFRDEVVNAPDYVFQYIIIRR